MKIPKIKWIPFDSNNPPANLNPDETFLIFLREDDYNNGASWHYSVDVASPYGDYLDNFWTTENDWLEGQRVSLIVKTTLERIRRDILTQRLSRLCGTSIRKTKDFTDCCTHCFISVSLLISKLKAALC